MASLAQRSAMRRQRAADCNSVFVSVMRSPEPTESRTCTSVEDDGAAEFFNRSLERSMTRCLIAALICDASVKRQFGFCLTLLACSPCDLARNALRRHALRLRLLVGLEPRHHFFRK